MRIFNILSKFFIVALTMVFSLSLSFLTAFCDYGEIQSGTETVTTGGESNISILIGISFLTIGMIGFIILKIKEKEKLQ